MTNDIFKAGFIINQEYWENEIKKIEKKEQELLDKIKNTNDDKIKQDLENQLKNSTKECFFKRRKLSSDQDMDNESYSSTSVERNDSLN